MGNPVVAISDGTLRGTTTEGFNNGLFLIFAFLGIPYAKPPLGNLRFKAPQPAEPWTGIRNATQDGSACYQKKVLADGEYFGSEDCLYMNVFTKNVSSEQALKPVLVYFHGGAFTVGSSNSTIYSPNFLLRNDIVFVTVNYRLGVLGFLSLNDSSLEVPGNAGMKDQVLALKWVQKNIAKFGGDPNRVTICGSSSGAVAVNYHLLSHSSNGLFRSGIMQSGSVLNPWPSLHPKSLEVVKYLRKKCECRTDKDILERLNSATVEELVEAQSKWIQSLEDATLHWFAPTVEKPNPTAFLTKRPIEVITSGEYQKVPIILGYNSNEGLFAATDNKEPERYKNGQFRPQQIVYPDDETTKKEVIEKMKKLYGNEKYGNNLYLPTADSMFTAGIVAMAEHFAISNPAPVYFYEFDLVASRNLHRHIFNLTGDQYIGASHADEQGYIFDSQILRDVPHKPGSVEDFTIYGLIKLIGNFLAYGTPTPQGNDLHLTWKHIEKDNFYYLYYGNESGLKRNPAEDRMKLWREAYNSNEQTKDYFP